MQVKLTVTARRRYREVLKFYSGYMTEREVTEVALRIREGLVFLRSFPNAGPYEDRIRSKKYRYRKWLVGKLKIVYRLQGNVIQVTDLFDGRQDPRKMKG